MPVFEAVRLALQTILAQKLKSAFSIIGVFIGVMFLIAVVSVVQGMNRYMTDKFAGTLLGVNTFRLRQFPDIQLGNVTDSTRRVWRRRPRVTYDDAQAVMRGVMVPVLAAWESSTRTTLVAGRKQAKDVEVTAATELYFDIRALPVERGRPFTEQEVQVGVPVLGEQAVRLEGVDQAAKEMRDLARDVPRLVVLEAAAIVLEQQRGGAGALDLLGDRQLPRLQIAREPVLLPVEHEARAGLEDVGPAAEQARVLGHLGAPAARHEHDLHVCAQARLDRARAVDRDRPLAVVHERGAAPQQRAVQVEIQAARTHARETLASGGRSTGAG